MANFGFVTIDTPANSGYETSAQIRARILARDAAERENSQDEIIAETVVTEDTGRATKQHTYVAVYASGMSYTYDGTRNGGKYQHFTLLPSKFDAVMERK